MQNGWNNGLQVLTYAEFLNKSDSPFAGVSDYQSFILRIWQFSGKAQPFAGSLVATWPAWFRREINIATDGKGISSKDFIKPDKNTWGDLDKRRYEHFKKEGYAI